MFKKKQPVQVVYKDNSEVKTNNIAKGSRTLKQLFAPSSISYMSDYDIRVENNYVKTFVINGYPSVLDIGWLDILYSYKGDMDVIKKVIPSDENDTLNELTNKISQFMAQLQIDEENGDIKNITELQGKIRSLIEQRVKVERNVENMFNVQISSALYTKEQKTLKKETQKLLSRLNGRHIGLMPLDIRNVEGYKTTSPFGISTINDYYRNMNTGALVSSFMFYNSEFTHQKGTFLGLTKSDMPLPILIDFFNKTLLPNANMYISGISGAGKTYFVCLLILRSVLECIRTVVVDVEGEYKGITWYSGGAVVIMCPGSEHIINPFDIDIEYEMDLNGEFTGKQKINIKAKISELLGLFSIMFPKLMDEDIKSIVSDCLMELYQNFGFTENPDSLYMPGGVVDEDGNYHDKVVKPMPRMTDFWNLLKKYCELYPMENLVKLHTALHMYVEGGVYDMFDNYTTVDINNEEYPVIDFDISGNEDENFRTIIMYVIMNWITNKFIKTNLKTKKRVICDEAWLMLKKTLVGSDYTAFFLENLARRIRKYNGSLVTASQNFRDCMSREEGIAVLFNASVKMFFKHTSEDISSLTDKFLLSDGEKSFLLSANKGEALTKIMGERFIVDVLGFDFETELIERKYLDNKE